MTNAESDVMNKSWLNFINDNNTWQKQTYI